MSATATLARNMARCQLFGIVMVGLLGGLGIGLAATAAAGARRADSAYTRLGHDSLKRTWSLVAESTAVIDQFTLPVAALLAIMVGAVAAAALLAVVADLITRRTGSADEIRGE